MDQTQQGGARATIFVVDDEPMLLDVAVKILESLNFRVRTFRDPRTALAEYVTANPPPAVVVADYAMSGMNGLDLIRECKLTNPGQKTILLSATVEEDICWNAPIKPDRFLAKPYKLGDFISLIETLVAMKPTLKSPQTRY